MRLSIFILLFSILLSNSFFLFAEPVYKSSNKNGIPIYSNKAKDNKAEKIDLPEITKGDFSPIQKNKLTCVGHGGINCQAGADQDGSVICYDNFRDSIQRFAFSCGAAKLDIIDQSFKTSSKGISIIVRNLSSVVAKDVIVKGPNNLILDGPKTLEPYDSAKYESKTEIPKNSKLEVVCSNCP